MLESVTVRATYQGPRDSRGTRGLVVGARIVVRSPSGQRTYPYDREASDKYLAAAPAGGPGAPRGPRVLVVAARIAGPPPAGPPTSPGPREAPDKSRAAARQYASDVLGWEGYSEARVRAEIIDSGDAHRVISLS